MQELTLDEVEQVNGGYIWLIAVAAALWCNNAY